MKFIWHTVTEEPRIGDVVIIHNMEYIVGNVRECEATGRAADDCFTFNKCNRKLYKVRCTDRSENIIGEYCWSEDEGIL